MNAVRAATASCALVIATAATSYAAPAGAPLTLPFDFSHKDIGLQVSLNGAPLFALLDTGVDPSVIDLARARALGLKVESGAGGKGSGFGEGAAPTVFPTRIAGLAVGGREMRPFDALASDLSTLSQSYGHPVDAVLGKSFLADKAVLIDYPARTVTIFRRGADARPLTRTCRLRWSTPMYTVDFFPMISDFRFGAASGPVSLDTGSNGGVGLFQSALALPGLKARLVPRGETLRHGFRGVSHAKLYDFEAPMSLGPFALPPGQPVVLRPEPGSKRRVANVGNAVLAAMGLRLLMDYPGERIAAYGECG
jgi:hypothetical protein